MNRRMFVATLASVAAVRGAVGIQKQCDVAQGYNFAPDQHLPVGHITQLTIGSSSVAADIRVADPVKAGLTMPVVSVLSDASWTTLPTDPILLQGRVSRANVQLLQAVLNQSPQKATVQIRFAIYEYDPVNQTYFTSFATRTGYQLAVPSPVVTAGVNGTLAKTDVLLGAQAMPDPAGVQNYSFGLTLRPAPAAKAQELLLQTSNVTKLVKGWGLPLS